MRVLDPTRGDADTYSKQPDELVQAILLSDPTRIITNPATPATPSFLNEQAHVNWCSYFTKAELAHQLGDYEKTISLLDEATNLGYQPEDLNEWLIYIDALARTDKTESAKEKSVRILNQDSRMKRGVCVVWRQLEAVTLLPAVDFQKSLGCNQ
jgi:tetratricopeptide (TPR) repeat protein